jgi:hypothetical protein
MPRRPVFQTATTRVGHWSENNEGLLTECGAVVNNRAPKIVVMNCNNCSRVVKARRGRAISNGKRAGR